MAVAALAATVVGGILAGSASADLGSSVARRVGSGYLDLGGAHSCVVLAGGGVKCWGGAAFGRLGYGNETTIGDNETPATVGTVSLGRKARAVAAGAYHTCAILDNGSVRCWGWNTNGELGLGNTDHVGDNELPSSVGPVQLGTGRTARAITAGDSHTCVILDTGRVKCWGPGSAGRLGYANEDWIGDNETPASVGTVDLGTGRTARAISAGRDHTCAILDTGAVTCWGAGGQGRLGYGNQNPVGDNETPASVGVVDIGTGRTARAIAAGGAFTCAILDNDSVRCWGYGMWGALGYGTNADIGDNEAPGTVGPVDLGAGRSARAIAADLSHVCAILDNAQVLCWGDNLYGPLGYGNTRIIGDSETPGSLFTEMPPLAPVALGAGRTARAIAAGGSHTCVLMDNAQLRCWGDGAAGQLGNSDTQRIGDGELPTAIGPVSLGAAMTTAATTTLTRAAKPTRDRSAPFRFVVSGLRTGAFAPDLVTCAGKVTIVAKQRSTVAGRATAVLKPTAAGCAYKVTLATKPTVRGTLTVTASAPASTNLLAAKSKPLAVRAG